MRNSRRPMSDNSIINKNGAGLYLKQSGELVPVHTGGDMNVYELKAYLREWDIDGVTVED